MTIEQKALVLATVKSHCGFANAFEWNAAFHTAYHAKHGLCSDFVRKKNYAPTSTTQYIYNEFRVYARYMRMKMHQYDAQGVMRFID